MTTSVIASGISTSTGVGILVTLDSWLDEGLRRPGIEYDSRRRRTSGDDGVAFATTSGIMLTFLLPYEGPDTSHKSPKLATLLKVPRRCRGLEMLVELRRDEDRREHPDLVDPVRLERAADKLASP